MSLNEITMFRYKLPAASFSNPLEKVSIKEVTVTEGRVYYTDEKNRTKYLKTESADVHGIRYHSQADGFHDSILFRTRMDAERRFEYDKIKVALNQNFATSKFFCLPLDLLRQINTCLENGDKDRISEYVIPQHSISTPLKNGLGTLCAVIGGDPDYPEIFTYVERPDGIQIDCCAVSQNGHSDGVTIYRWLDTSTDAYTDSAVVSAENINSEA